MAGNEGLFAPVAMHKLKQNKDFEDCGIRIREKLSPPGVRDDHLLVRKLTKLIRYTYWVIQSDSTRGQCFQ
eukprot:735188-Pelagomonas_calceolata.AAC.2